MTSRVAELAREEADRAEAESPDEPDTLEEPDTDDDDDEDGDEDGDEEQPSAFAAPPLAPEPADPGFDTIGPKELERAERARDAQRRKLAGILGDAFVAHECLLCSGLGFMPEAPPPGAIFEVVADEEGYRVEVQAPPPEIPLLKAPDKTTCDECDGWGEVLSGSKAPHGMVTPCSKCAGNGWVTVARPTPTIPTVQVTMGSGQPNGAGTMPQLPVDGWGREPGHPHYGIPPAQITG